MPHEYSDPSLVPNPQTPGQAVVIDREKCIGCNACVEVCRTEVLLPNPVEGEPPIVMYPDECWFAGCCMSVCPVPGAITMEHPLTQRVGWIRKDTGDFFRMGMRNPPPQTYKRPASCGPTGGCLI
jgi:NAD-dependent dihydropyrimidine dehydrogenase PreA subunit